MSRAIEAAKAFVKIYAEDSSLRRALTSVKASLAATVGFAKAAGAAMSKAMLATGIGAIVAGVGAAVAAVQQFTDMGAGIDDVAKRTGASAEGLSQLKYAAEQSGAGLEDVEKGMRKLGDVTTSAANGGKSAQKALDAVGLSAETLAGMSVEDQMLAVAEGISRIQDPGAKAAAAMDLLGKSGASLLPMMEDGAAGIQAMMQEADQLGLTVTGPQAEAAAAMDDAWAKLSSTFTITSKVIGSALVPVLTKAMNFAAAMVPVVMQLASALGQMLVTAAENAYAAMGSMLSGFAPVMAAAQETFGAIIDALTSGDVALAAKVFWLAIKAAWLQGTAAISQEWLIWKQAFLQTFSSAMAGLKTAWANTQNWLSSGIVDLMAMIDDSINADAVKAELDVMLKQQTSAIESQAKADQKAASAAFEADFSKVTADLEAAKAEWAAAVGQAKTNAEKAANAPTAADAATGKFTELIKELKAGDIATRVEAAVTGGTSENLRSVSGAGQLTGIINQQGALGAQQVQILRQIQTQNARLLTVTERGQIGYAV